MTDAVGTVSPSEDEQRDRPEQQITAIANGFDAH
jgi:hypothetical protein